eukprot:sb/3463086/
MLLGEIGLPGKSGCPVYPDLPGKTLLPEHPRVKDRFVLTESKQDLTIQKTIFNDTGLYKCKATSGDESDEASATLTVLKPIDIIEYPTHRRLLLGSSENIILTVKVQSADDNSMSLSWTVDGTKIDGDSTSRSIATPSAAGTQNYTVIGGGPALKKANGTLILVDGVFYVKDRFVLTESKQDLTIQKTIFNDTGLYKCKATSGDESDEASATLTVLKPIDIIEYPTHRRLLLGSSENIILTVKVQSADDNSMSLSWTVDGTKIDGDSTSRSIATPSAAGTQNYTVKASLNSWQGNTETDEKTIYVTTFEADEEVEAVIIQAPVDKTAILGSTVTFECVAYGIPDPSVKWSNGSADMDSSSYTTVYTERGVESRLVISNVKTQYKVTQFDSVVYGVPGKSLMISVTVDYQNPIERSMCSWTRNGVELVEESGSLEISSDGLTLTIGAVETTSAGLYSFTIDTEAGSATTSTTMEIIDSYVSPTASIPKYHDDVNALLGSAFTLKCDVSGKPTPDVSWQKKAEDGVETLVFSSTTSTDYKVLGDSSLIINSVRANDTGKWTCVAESRPETQTLTSEAHLNLEAVEWLATPFVYPYHGHQTITVVSGDTLEANIEVI